MTHVSSVLPKVFADCPSGTTAFDVESQTYSILRGSNALVKREGHFVWAYNPPARAIPQLKRIGYRFSHRRNAYFYKPRIKQSKKYYRIKLAL
jgi:hypothetical protein